MLSASGKFLTWVITIYLVCPMVTESNDEVVANVDEVTSKVNEFGFLLIMGGEGQEVVDGGGLTHNESR